MVPGRFAVVVAATGVIAADVRDKPFKADGLAQAKRMVTAALGADDGEDVDEVLADEGLQVVPLSYALELAYKGIKPRPVKVPFTKGPAFQRVVDLVADAEGGFDAVGLSMRSHDTEGRYVQLSTTLPRLSKFFKGALIRKAGTKAYTLAELDAAGYPAKTGRRKEDDSAPTNEATVFQKEPAWDEWLARYRRWLEKEVA